ncbi:hypothetical protein BC829DRAFT_422935 [Chytridium lagenaria]|nr:hypothetical protein BC829DRAFT_422935 [Chytridium lagenaria]
MFLQDSPKSKKLVFSEKGSHESDLVFTELLHPMQENVKLTDFEVTLLQRYYRIKRDEDPDYLQADLELMPKFVTKAARLRIGEQNIYGSFFNHRGRKSRNDSFVAANIVVDRNESRRQMPVELVEKLGYGQVEFYIIHRWNNIVSKLALINWAGSDINIETHERHKIIFFVSTEVWDSGGGEGRSLMRYTKLGLQSQSDANQVGTVEPQELDAVFSKHPSFPTPSQSSLHENEFTDLLEAPFTMDPFISTIWSDLHLPLQEIRPSKWNEKADFIGQQNSASSTLARSHLNYVPPALSPSKLPESTSSQLMPQHAKGSRRQPAFAANSNSSSPFKQPSRTSSKTFGPSPKSSVTWTSSPIPFHGFGRDASRLSGRSPTQPPKLLDESIGKSTKIEKAHLKKSYIKASELFQHLVISDGERELLTDMSLDHVQESVREACKRFNPNLAFTFHKIPSNVKTKMKDYVMENVDDFSAKLLKRARHDWAVNKMLSQTTNALKKNFTKSSGKRKRFDFESSDENDLDLNIISTTKKRRTVEDKGKEDNRVTADGKKVGDSRNNLSAKKRDREAIINAALLGVNRRKENDADRNPNPAKNAKKAAVKKGSEGKHATKETKSKRAATRKVFSDIEVAESETDDEIESDDHVQENLTPTKNATKAAPKKGRGGQTSAKKIKSVVESAIDCDSDSGDKEEEEFSRNYGGIDEEMDQSNEDRPKDSDVTDEEEDNYASSGNEVQVKKYAHKKLFSNGNKKHQANQKAVKKPPVLRKQGSAIANGTRSKKLLLIPPRCMERTLAAVGPSQITRCEVARIYRREEACDMGDWGYEFVVFGMKKIYLLVK